MYIGLDVGSEKERLIPLTWDKAELEFKRDNVKEIQYKGSSCVIDETKDSELAAKLAINYLNSENVCVCSS